MNPSIERQLEHRTIRFFKDERVETAQVEQIYEVMNRTATSSGLQTYSVIRVTDQNIKDKISEICKQAYVAHAPELCILLVDQYRNTEIARAKGDEAQHYGDMNNFFQGVADVYLAAQNMTNAIESLGLGAVYLGSVLNDAQAMIELLQLPKFTFPLLGLAFGYPNDNPQLKPRMALDLKVGNNGYPFAPNHDYGEAIVGYDQAMTHYYDTRENNRRSDTFSDQIIAKQKNTLLKRQTILKIVESQGFDLGLE